jgi:hypothetical protein
MAKLVIQPRACNEAMAQALPRAVLAPFPVRHFCRFSSTRLESRPLIHLPSLSSSPAKTRPTWWVAAGVASCVGRLDGHGLSAAVQGWAVAEERGEPAGPPRGQGLR